MTFRDNIKAPARDADLPAPMKKSSATLWSIGGILAGLAAASCCVAPFGLFLAGISGAWIANLTALEPYRPYFAAAAMGCIAYGFYRAYRKPAVACPEGSYCARPASDRIAKIGLWSATAIVAVALVSPYVIAQWL
jgi:mercuric ion transport protein